MKKIPKQIKLAGHWWKIRYDKGLTKRHGKYGQCDYENLVIYIEPSITDTLKSHTLVHEIVHAISDQFVYANALSEETVSQLAVGFWVMLSDLDIELDWTDIEG